MSKNINPKQFIQVEKELELLNKKKEQIQAHWNHIEQVKQFQMIAPPQVNPESPLTQFNMNPNSPRSGSHQSRKRDWYLRNKRQFYDSNGAKRPKKVEKKQEEYVLTEDCEPSIKLQGRLELGLGHVLKEMKTNFPHPPYDIMFIRGESMKTIKYELRDRIRKIMMGKNVSGLEFLLETYRASFPLSTDQLFLDEIKLKLERHSEIVSEQTASLMVVKRYIGETLDTMIGDIFKKVNEFYEEEQRADREEMGQSGVNMDESSAEGGNESNATTAIECVTDEQIKEALKIAPLDHNKLMQFVRNKLHVLLPTYTPYIKKILFGDKSFVDFVMQIPNNVKMSGYYIKIMGRPALPKKCVMLSFLRDYSLITMRRHKTMPNLLNVCVASEADIEGLMEYNNGDIDNILLLMRPEGSNDYKLVPNETDPEENIGLVEFNNDDDANDFYTDMEDDEEEEEVVDENGSPQTEQ